MQEKPMCKMVKLVEDTMLLPFCRIERFWVKWSQQGQNRPFIQEKSATVWLSLAAAENIVDMIMQEILCHLSRKKAENNWETPNCIPEKKASREKQRGGMCMQLSNLSELVIRDKV